MLSSGDNFPHLIQKRRSQIGFVTYLLNYPRTYTRLQRREKLEENRENSHQKRKFGGAKSEIRNLQYIQTIF